MTKEPAPGPRPPAMSAKRAARLQREAKALRANLRKRKDQERAREKPKQERAVPEPPLKRKTTANSARGEASVISTRIGPKGSKIAMTDCLRAGAA